MTNNREFFVALQEAGISFTQLKCVGVLQQAGGPMSLSALADELALSPAAISRAVDGLVQRGELKREEDPEDRRSKIVSLAAARAADLRAHHGRAAGRPARTSSRSWSPRSATRSARPSTPSSKGFRCD